MLRNLLPILLLTSSVSAQISISGTVTFEDFNGDQYPARGVALAIAEANYIYGSSTAGTGTTDLNGHFTVAVTIRPGIVGYRIDVSAENAAGFVNTTGIPGTRTIVSSDFFTLGAAGDPHDIVARNTTNAGRSFEIVDALYTGRWFATAARGGLPPAPIGVQFPDPGVKPKSRFDGIKLIIAAADSQDWDAINHEYGHYVALGDALMNTAGIAAGGHTYGVSNIPAQQTALGFNAGKSAGMRLAWSEALASFAAIAAHNFEPFPQNLPLGIPNVYDTRLTDTINQHWWWDIETRDTSEGLAVMSGEGEGDEMSVARILWDIADSNADYLDSVAFPGGPTAFWPALKALRPAVDPAIPGGATRTIDRLADVWTELAEPASIADRTRFGAIFEANAVSPMLIDGFISLNPAAPSPTISFLRNNRNANDSFTVFILANDLSSIRRSFDFENRATTPNPTGSFTFPAAELVWLKANPGTYKLVLAGGDLLRPDAAAYPTSISGPRYWGGAIDLVVAASSGPSTTPGGPTPPRKVP